MNKTQKTIINITLLCLLLLITTTACSEDAVTTKSPNGKLTVTFQLNENGQPTYSAQLDGKNVIIPSALGLKTSNADFTKGLTIESSTTDTIKDNYTMLLGKRKNCSYNANQRTFTLKNQQGQKLQIIFNVSDDGLAFRYAIPQASEKSFAINEEVSHFAFDPNTVSWLHPMQPGKSGWNGTQPSYEEHYEIEKTVGNPSPTGAGWCFPALFKTPDNIWTLICDSDVDETYCATRLANDSTGGIYKLAFPDPKENRGAIDPVNPNVTVPFKSPWRVLIIGDSLASIVESTLITDVAKKCEYKNTDFIKPGKAAWHWLRYSDNSATLEYANLYLDFAAKMKWQYMLIDCNWDKLIGDEKMAEFVKTANAKNVDVILWYNSNGPWNTAPMTPKNKMHEKEIRRQEFAKLQKMGVKGVKIDFFGGDKQATMKFYIDILKDAADYGILVNCHGATIPRGWQRTYPNLMTMEAVMGMEYCTFDQNNTNQQPQHCSILPFTRNVIGSMDFTPTVIAQRIRGVRLRTTMAFELALPVVFESGIQHLGLSPDEYELMPDYVVEYLQNVPTVWDETKFIDGYPGKFVCIARRSGDKWYIAGINGENEQKQLSLNLAFLPANTTATLITDNPTEREFKKESLDEKTTQKPNIELNPNGGFVIITQ